MKTTFVHVLIVTLGILIYVDSTNTYTTSPQIYVAQKDTINPVDTIHITEVPIVIHKPATLEIPHHLRTPYKIESPIDGIIFSPVPGIMGIGISINIQRLYARYFEISTNRFREFERKDVLEGYLDLVWLPITATYTGLENEDLHYFRSYYRPSVEFITHREHHDRVSYVIGKVRNYKDSSQHIRDQVDKHFKALASDLQNLK